MSAYILWTYSVDDWKRGLAGTVRAAPAMLLAAAFGAHDMHKPESLTGCHTLVGMECPRDYHVEQVSTGENADQWVGREVTSARSTDLRVAIGGTLRHSQRSYGQLSA